MTALFVERETELSAVVLQKDPAYTLIPVLGIARHGAFCFIMMTLFGGCFIRGSKGMICGSESAAVMLSTGRWVQKRDHDVYGGSVFPMKQLRTRRHTTTQDLKKLPA